MNYFFSCISLNNTNLNKIVLFRPNITTYSKYYPFGMLMPGWNGGSFYRYSFIGMERDNEVTGKGNHLDFGNMSNRLGRFISEKILSVIISFLIISNISYSQEVLPFEQRDSLDLRIEVNESNNRIYAEFYNKSSRAIIVDTYESDNQGNFILFAINEKGDSIKSRVHYRKREGSFRPNFTGVNIFLIGPNSKVKFKLNLHMCGNREKCNLISFFNDKSFYQFFIKYEPRVFHKKITGDLYRDFIVNNMWKGSINSNAITMDKKIKKKTVLCDCR